MGWQDRSYYRDPRPGQGNPLSWLLYGSVPLFTLFGIRVRAHATLIITAALVLLFGVGLGFERPIDRIIVICALFVIVLLHEFGHCFAARWVGGHAEEIMMHPLGGLAMAYAPRRPWGTFVTVAGGPLVNVLICAMTAVVLWLVFDVHAWNLLSKQAMSQALIKGYRAGGNAFGTWGVWIFWIHLTSWGLLLFNLLPIFPLDGGQLLQSILWPKFGYYKSMLFAATTGIVGGIILAAFGLVTLSIVLLLIGAMGVMNCINMRRMLLAEGPWAFQEEDSFDYSSSLFQESKAKTKQRSARAVKKAKEREERERAEQEQVDQILAKVSANGMNSLSWWEKRTLKRATEKQRKREVALREEMKSRGF